MSKFMLSGPISFLPTKSPLNGLLSIPFICACLLNSMFGIRAICIENSFFTSYRHQALNLTTYAYDTKTIDPIIPPEFRLLAYLFPCLISFVINAARLSSTTKGLRGYLMQYPQFFVACCFTPFMFEGYKVNNSQNTYSVRIWQLGTFINALFIGCLPQCILLFTEYYKGVPSWEFVGNKLWYQNNTKIFESNDALFKYQYGNTIFATTTCTFFFSLSLLFFCTETLFKKRGIHCRFLHILCCPCSQPCLFSSGPDSNTSSSEIVTNVEHNTKDESLEKENDVKELQEATQPHTQIYLYNKHKKICLVGKPSNAEENIPL